MPHIGERFIFYGIPKTGSSWVRAALDSLGVEVVRETDYHGTPQSMSDSQRKDRFEFTFVRHPVTWLRSFWAMRMHDYGPKGARLDPEALRQKAQEAMLEAHIHGSELVRPDFYYPPDQFMSRSFDEFCLNIQTESPGYVTRLFKLYVPHVAFVGRQESLREHLLTALRLAGVDCATDGWVEPAPLQTALPEILALDDLTDPTRQMVIDNESWVIDNYYGRL